FQTNLIPWRQLLLAIPATLRCCRRTCASERLARALAMPLRRSHFRGHGDSIPDGLPRSKQGMIQRGCDPFCCPKSETLLPPWETQEANRLFSRDTHASIGGILSPGISGQAGADRTDNWAANKAN